MCRQDIQKVHQINQLETKTQNRHHSHNLLQLSPQNKPQTSATETEFDKNIVHHFTHKQQHQDPSIQ